MAGVRRQLEEAKSRAQVVRVCREGLEDGWVNGFVVALGPEFFALEIFDKAARLDGLNCLRYRDITECAAPAPYADFLERALVARALARNDSWAVDMSSLPNLLRSVAQTHPLVTVFYEGDEGYCHIGRIVDVTEREVRILEVTPNARWETEPTAHLLDGLTRVDVGGAYEAALHLVAGGN